MRFAVRDLSPLRTRELPTLDALAAAESKLAETMLDMMAASDPSNELQVLLPLLEEEKTQHMSVIDALRSSARDLSRARFDEAERFSQYKARFNVLSRVTARGLFNGNPELLARLVDEMAATRQSFDAT